MADKEDLYSRNLNKTNTLTINSESSDSKNSDSDSKGKIDVSRADYNAKEVLSSILVTLILFIIMTVFLL